MSSSIRDRKFCVILYPDDSSHMEAFEKLFVCHVSE